MCVVHISGRINCLQCYFYGVKWGCGGHKGSYQTISFYFILLYLSILYECCKISISYFLIEKSHHYMTSYSGITDR